MNLFNLLRVLGKSLCCPEPVIKIKPLVLQILLMMLAIISVFFVPVNGREFRDSTDPAAVREPDKLVTADEL